jgi:subtilisin-like proprotein convertase family protein
MKKAILTSFGVLAMLSAHATLYVTGWTNGVNATLANSGVVPDANYSGWTDTRTVATAPAGTLVGVAVTLNISGGWNGDLFAYLANGAGYTVLLDHIGTGTYGNAGSGFNVTFSDSGAADLGTYMGNGSSPITGAWQPDGAGFASFVGLNPNSTWTLFIADTSGGSISTVQSWGLEMNIVAVPEVEAWLAAALAGVFGAFWISRTVLGKAIPAA